MYLCARVYMCIYHTHTTQTHTVSSKVQDLQLELKALREQVESTEGELVLKNQKLADAETEAKMMRVRHGVLSAQVSEQQQVQETLEKNSVSHVSVYSCVIFHGTKLYITFAYFTPYTG